MQDKGPLARVMLVEMPERGKTGDVAVDHSNRGSRKGLREGALGTGRLEGKHPSTKEPRSQGATAPQAQPCRHAQCTSYLLLMNHVHA